MSKTRTKCNAWAETQPWPCLVRATNCCSPTHDHSPMVGDGCAHPDCTWLLPENEVCYAVTQIEREDGREQWVCWRHVVDESGEFMEEPIRVPVEVHDE